MWHGRPARESTRNMRVPLLILKLDELEFNRRVANVLSPVSQRIAINDVAGFELGFRDSPINRVIARLATFDHVDHIRWMRMRFLFVTGLKRSFENPYFRILEFERDRL